MDIFNVTKSEKFLLIEITKDLVSDDMNAISIFIKKLLDEPEKILIFDFTKCLNISSSIFQLFGRFSREAATSEKKFFSLHLNPVLQKKIRAAGLERAFNITDDLGVLQKKNFQDSVSAPPHQTKSGAIDVEFINPFVKATQHTFSIQAHTPVELGNVFIKASEYDKEIAIASVISIASEVFKGSLTLCFSKKIFLQIYENMNGEKHTEITAEIEDACGELLNIICGVAKAELNTKHGYTIQKAMPIVLSAEKMKIRQTTSQSIVVVPFKTASGDFYLEIATESVG